MVGAGGLYTSVLDACGFVQLHLRRGAPLLEQALADAMYVPPSAQPGQDHGYGLGIMSGLWDGLLVRGHSGGGFGFLADLYWAPELEIGVAVLTNSVNHPLQVSLACRVLTELAGGSVERLPHPPSARPMSTEGVSSFVGEYAGRPGWLTIAAEGASCVLISGEVRHPLRVIAPDEVMLTDAPHERFRILADGRGELRYLLRLSDGVVWYRNDVEHRGSTPRRWAECTGDYVIKAQGVPISHVRLCTDGEMLLYEEPPGTHGLRLHEYEPGIFYSSTGEVLNLTREPPTYGGIGLGRIADRQPAAPVWLASARRG
jgi:hypothetical protein